MKLSNSRRKKAIALSMGLAVAVLSASNVQAQGLFGDLRDNYYEDEEQVSIAGLLDDLIDIYYQEVEQAGSRGMMLRGSGDGGYALHNETFGTDGAGYTLSNQTFGQDAPLGGGLLILGAAGIGYAAMRRRKDA